jgi:hypothetical protein
LLLLCPLAAPPPRVAAAGCLLFSVDCTALRLRIRRGGAEPSSKMARQLLCHGAARHAIRGAGPTYENDAKKQQHQKPAPKAGPRPVLHLLLPAACGAVVSGESNGAPAACPMADVICHIHILAGIRCYMSACTRQMRHCRRTLISTTAVAR